MDDVLFGKAIACLDPGLEHVGLGHVTFKFHAEKVSWSRQLDICQGKQPSVEPMVRWEVTAALGDGNGAPRPF